MSDFIERNFSREVELLKALVRVPSDNPPGDCARHGEQLLPSLPGASHNQDGYFYALLRKL